MKPRLLDLFCGAGGCAMGYARAGFEVVGVDLAPQKHYPFEFHQADALTFDLAGFDVVHASPPCQGNSATRYMKSAARWRTTPDLVTPMYERLRASGRPWVIENVPGAMMPDSIVLCGSMFGLEVRRHRLFAASHLLFAPCGCRHVPAIIEVMGGKVRGIGTHRVGDAFITPGGYTQRHEGSLKKADGQRAMGIDWMTIAEMCEAIPPAYTEWIGRQLLAVLANTQAA